MSKDNYYNLVDFGYSKINFSVFDINLNAKYSETKELNFEKNNKFETIIELIKKAEKKNSFHVKDIILLFDTADLFNIEISLIKNLNKSSKMSHVYDSLILELNNLISLYYKKFYPVHIIVNKCIIGDKIYYDLPKEKLLDQNIKIDFKAICFPKKIIQDVKEKFIDNNLNVTNIFCSSYVKTLSYLKKLKINEVSFLEIGWERTTLISYKNEKLKLIKSIPIGGFHITKDISNIFKISLEESEKIKRSFNKSYTEFSYKENQLENSIKIKDLLRKNISIDTLKKVILYRVQEIIDLSFKDSKKIYSNSNVSDLFLIGRGSLIFNNNTFYLNDKFNFKSINFYSEVDYQICKSGLVHYLNTQEIRKIVSKKNGIFERFFNYFSK